MSRVGRSFRGDFTRTLAVNVAVAALNLVTGVLVAKILRPTGRGDLAAIFLWPTLLAVLATMGTGEALVYFGARHREEAGRWFGTALAIGLVASAVAVVVGWFALPVLLWSQPDNVVTPARWYLLQIPVVVAFTLVVRMLQGLRDVRAWNVARLLPTLVWFGVLVVAAVRDRAAPRTLALGFLIGRALVLPVAWLLLRRRLDDPVRPDRELRRPLLRFGLPSVLTVLPSQLNVRLDQLLMAAFLPGRDLGLYVAAVSWSQFPSPALAAYGSLLFPRVAAAGPDERAGLAAQAMRLGVAGALGLGAVALALTPVGIPLLFGREYRGALDAAWLLVPAGVVAGFGGIQQELLRGIGKPTAVLRSQLIGLGGTVVALALLLGPWGIVGAATASLVGYGLTVVALTVSARRELRVPVHQLLVPRPADLRLVAAAWRSRSGAGGDRTGTGDPGDPGDQREQREQGDLRDTVEHGGTPDPRDPGDHGDTPDPGDPGGATAPTGGGG